ncbi:hypothetical protein KIPB_014323, partial [Kipferlia bialata]|eukprot:g14323.t1
MLSNQASASAEDVKLSMAFQRKQRKQLQSTSVDQVKALADPLAPVPNKVATFRHLRDNFEYLPIPLINEGILVVSDLCGTNVDYFDRNPLLALSLLSSVFSYLEP